jgi:signal peptidase II
LKVLYATFSIVIADQLTKLLVRGIRIPVLGIDLPGMMLYSSREVLGHALRLTYIKNPGTAFGIGPAFTEIFAVFSLLASVAIFVYLYSVRGQGAGIRFSFAIILGGAVGNMLDRVFVGPIFDGTALFQGRVVDFIDVNLFHLPFVFNIADAAITIGVVLLILFQGTRIGEAARPEIAGGGEIGDGAETGETSDRPDRAA